MTDQGRIQNAVKHLIWSYLRKQLTAEYGANYFHEKLFIRYLTVFWIFLCQRVRSLNGTRVTQGLRFKTFSNKFAMRVYEALESCPKKFWTPFSIMWKLLQRFLDDLIQQRLHQIFRKLMLSATQEHEEI